MFSYQSILTYVLGAQKNCHIETFLLGTHSICFKWEIKIIIFWYTLLRTDNLLVHLKVSVANTGAVWSWSTQFVCMPKLVIGVSIYVQQIASADDIFRGIFS